MKIRQVEKSNKLIVFPDGHEFKAFKQWWLEFAESSSSDDFYDKTAGCYVIRSVSISELELFGFKIEKLTQKQYSKMVGETLAKGYYQEEEGV